jgi:hypothetical protein
MSMRHITCVFALTIAMPVVAAQSDNVLVRDLGNGRYELSITLAEIVDPAQGQAALVPKVLELCGSLRPEFGRYRFEGTEPLAGTKEVPKRSLQYTQEIECKDPSAPLAVNDIPPAPATPPTDEDEADIRKRTLAYLEAKDTNDFDAAFAMLGPTIAGYMTSESWRAPRTAFNAATAGQPEREVIRITWYDDPQNAPTPGRYAAADYRASYASKGFYCGYVMWLRQQDGSYLIVREEEGQATPDMVATIAPESMPQARMQLGCRD